MLVYPPYYNYKTKFIPSFFDVDKMEMTYGTTITRKDKYWEKYLIK